MSKIITGSNAKYYNHFKKIWQEICNLYNYEYVGISTNLTIEDLASEIKNLKTNKFYTDDSKLFGVITKDTSAESLTEVITLCYRTLECLGLEDIRAFINPTKIKDEKTFDEYILYLDIDYEYTSKNNDFFKIVYENKTLVEGFINADYLAFTLNIPDIISILSKENKMPDDLLDVIIMASTLEEKVKALTLIQDLRWSDAKCEFTPKDTDIKSRFLITINEEDLKKGLLKVKDNVTNEITEVDENEIIDYIISNL